MKNARYALLGAALLFISSAPIAMADPYSNPGAPTTPQPFSFICDPYTAPLISGVSYMPSGSVCTYTLPQTGSYKTVGIYKGVPGNSVPVKRGFTIGNSATTLSDTGYDFSAASIGDTYFAAAYSSDTFNDVLTTDGYLQNGAGMPTPDLTTIQWTWGPTPPVSISSPQPGATYSTGAAVLPLANIANLASYTSVVYTLNGTPVDPNAPLPIATLPSGPATFVIAATDALGNTTYATSTFTITGGRSPLTITADNKQMELGSPVPTLTSTITGFTAPDTATSSDVTGTPSCTTTANSGSAPGTYPITCTIGTLTSPAHYAFTYFVAGTLTVVDTTKPVVTIAAPINGHAYLQTDSVTPAVTITDFAPTTATYTFNGAVVNPTAPLSIASLVGTEVFVVSATDSSGNKTTATSTFTVQAPAPALPGNCLIALNPTAKGAVTLSGSASIKMTGCKAQVNSSAANAVDISGASTLTSGGNCVVGTVKKSGSPTVSPTATPCSAKADPFATYTKPVVPTTCSFTNYSTSGAKTVTLSPGTYCGGISFNGSSNVTFLPGLYILKDGGLTTSGATNITGNGVSFFLTGKNAGFTFAGSNNLTLTAAQSGTLPGFLFFVDPASTNALTTSAFSGAANINFTGVVYLPHQALSLAGSASTMGAAHFTAYVADTFNISGSSNISIDGTHPSTPIPSGL